MLNELSLFTGYAGFTLGLRLSDVVAEFLKHAIRC